MKESAFKSALFTILSQGYPMCVGYERHAPTIDAITALVETSFDAKIEADVIEVPAVVVEADEPEEKIEVKEPTDEADQIAKSENEVVSETADAPVSGGSDGDDSDDGETDVEADKE